MAQQFDVRIIEQSRDGTYYRAEVTPVQNFAPILVIFAFLAIFALIDKIATSLGISWEQAANLFQVGILAVGAVAIALTWRFRDSLRRFFH